MVRLRYDPRVFLALTVSRTAQERLGIIQAELRKYLTSWHFVPVPNFHLTLRFFGEVPEPSIGALDARCRELAPRCAPFSLHFNRLDYYGEPQAARVLYFGAEDSPELAKLAQAVWQAFPDDSERRRFSPHITLAKARKQLEPSIERSNANMLQRLRDLGRVGPEPLNIDVTTVHRELVLMETVWVGRAVEYEVRERYPFGV
jgi:RNA 2',3'-cyclic 3'-phosphodiesterase